MTEVLEQPAPITIEDELDWVITREKILNKAGDLVPFVPNDQQLLVIGWMFKQLRAELPVRIIVLKARQMGISTIVEGLFFALTYLHENLRALVTAHDDDSSTELFMMNKIFEASLPEHEQRPTDASSRKEIVYSHPHNSRFRVQTAGSERLGRGSTYHMVHASEVAFWSHAAKTLLSVLQAVPDLPGTMVVIESTANGVGGEFHKRWLKAEEEWRERPGRLDGYIPIFLPWWVFAEYKRTPPEDYEFGELDEDEQILVDRFNLAPDRLYWRRRTIIDKCGGNVDQFKQEYPSFPAEAFLLSGRRAIHASITTRHRRTVETYTRGWFVEKHDGRVVLEFDNTRTGPHWRIYRDAIEDHDYAVGEDVAEGELSDPSDEKSDPDSSATTILDRVTLETAAVLESRLDVDIHTEQTRLACIYYNQAWGAPEVNSAGVAAVLHLKRKNYARTYRRESSEDQIETCECNSLGWRTTAANRNLLIDDWIAATRRDEHAGWSGRIQVLDERIVEQEESFVYKPTGKREHATGCHDDVLFSAMIAWQVHQRCPRTRPIDLEPEPVATQPRGVVGESDPGIEGLYSDTVEYTG